MDTTDVRLLIAASDGMLYVLPPLTHYVKESGITRAKVWITKGGNVCISMPYRTVRLSIEDAAEAFAAGRIYSTKVGGSYRITFSEETHLARRAVQDKLAKENAYIQERMAEFNAGRLAKLRSL